MKKTHNPYLPLPITLHLPEYTEEAMRACFPTPPTPDPPLRVIKLDQPLQILEEGRCTGHCCKRFHLDLDALTDPEGNVRDGDYVRDMLIELEVAEGDAPVFTCRHFGGVSCTQYDSRPAMCRDYPYRDPCSFAGCTLKEDQ